MGVAGGAGLLVDIGRPGIFTGGDERPPIDGMAYTAIGGIAKPDLAGTPGGLGNRGESCVG